MIKKGKKHFTNETKRLCILKITGQYSWFKFERINNKIIHCSVWFLGMDNFCFQRKASNKVLKKYLCDFFLFHNVLSNIEGRES